MTFIISSYNSVMISNKLGYCCINQTLNTGKNPVFTGRKLIKRMFTMDKADVLSVKNCTDLLTILKWNEDHNIKVFRIGSEILPRSNDPECGYSINDLKSSDIIKDLLAEVGKYAYQHNHQLSFHPGAYTCIGSPSEQVCNIGIQTLECENEIANAICRDVQLDIPINFHIGGSYGETFVDTSIRFINSFNRLSDSLKRRVVIENDDKASCWSAARLCNLISQQTNIPICFDFHHYLFCNEYFNIGLTLQDEFDMCYKTWNGRSMQVHYSQSPTPDKLVPKHSEYYRDPLPEWINEYDNIHIHLECKQKELALIDYRNKFC